MAPEHHSNPGRHQRTGLIYKQLPTYLSRLLRPGRSLASLSIPKGGDVAQRSIEVLIGRLITDEAFRSAFCASAETTLAEFVESGWELTAVEIAALHTTPARTWKRIAKYIDPRLQKVPLRGRSEEQS